MALTVYGQSGSRAMRTLWMVEELGVDYRHEPTRFKDEAHEPEFLAVNPNGRVPAIDHDGLVVWESMAINLYLAKAFPSEFSPDGLAEETAALQWSFWVMTEVEKPLLYGLFHTLGMFGMEKSAARAGNYLKELDRPFAVLEAHLADREYLLGERFTVADLNVAGVLSFAELMDLDLSRWPKLAAWFRRCMDRPALARARELP